VGVLNGLTIRNTQVVWTTPKNSIYGAALDQDQDLVLDQDSFNSTAMAK
jgi:hypothetical protein